jgi:Carboxypeptidase regulatory-like domain
MSKILLSSVFLAALSSVAASAQTTAPTQSGSTGDQNTYATLDNHRPLIQKKEKAPTSRSVTGKVVDDTGQPLEGALVTLTDGKTHQKTTVISKKDGRYNFDNLAFNIDYELQARYKDSLSTQRKLSQYGHTVNVVRILEIESPAEPTAEAKK